MLKQVRKNFTRRGIDNLLIALSVQVLEKKDNIWSATVPRTVIDTARIGESARNPCRLSISWTSQDIDS